MDWEGREESQNVDDRRGMGRKAGIAGGGILVVILAALFGVNPDKLKMFFGGAGGAPQQRKFTPEEERMARFTKVVFGDTERIWDELFRQRGERYKKPRLVLFSGVVESACGEATSAVGPFYCPGDDQVYIDLSFYTDMEKKLDAPGEFARAYVIAHEVGHHVQRFINPENIKKVNRARHLKLPDANKQLVRLELQADYLAGVWAHHGQKKYNFLEPGDVESALRAAFEIGDDRLQKKARGVVVPDAFTHGTSKQRMYWFKRGLRTGKIDDALLLFSMDYDDL